MRPAVVLVAVLACGCIHRGPHSKLKSAPHDTTAPKMKLPTPEPRPLVDPYSRAEAR